MESDRDGAFAGKAWAVECSAAVRGVWSREAREAAMQQVADALWDSLRDRDVSWLGFYLDQADEPNDRRLILGPHRDRPACSPIGLHGVCGTALVNAETQIINDVRALGDAYVACDPRDRSELVIPLFENDDRLCCWGVFDLDSATPSRFTAADAEAVRSVLRAAGMITDS